MLCPVDKKRERAGAMELGKMLTSESCLLHVVPSRQEASENRCNGTGQDANPVESSSPHYAYRQEGNEK
jgi:hypothetical protein